MELPWTYRAGQVAAIAAPGACSPALLRAGLGEGVAGSPPAGRPAHPAVTQGHTLLPSISPPRPASTKPFELASGLRNVSVPETANALERVG